MITRKKLSFLMIFVACLLALLPSVVLADGGNPPPPAQYKYVPPPYMGNITVQWFAICNGYNGCVSLTGTLTRAGTGVECDLDFYSEVGVSQSTFANHTTNDLQGRQFIGYDLDCPGLYEIIAAHGLFYNLGQTLFTVDVIVMEIVSQ